MEARCSLPPSLGRLPEGKYDIMRNLLSASMDWSFHHPPPASWDPANPTELGFFKNLIYHI